MTATASTNGAPLLELHGVSHRYGRVRALHDVSLSIRRGELVAVFGQNGAGKSTLAAVVAGLLVPSEGTVRTTLERRTRRAGHGLPIAVVPEGRRLFGQLSVRDNLLLGASVLREPRSRTMRRLSEVLELFPVNLRDRLNVPAAALSGGEQQMAAIGRALMSEPDLIVLDEPSLGLAPITVQLVHDVLEELRDGGRTVVLIEQEIAALDRASRCLVLERGEVAYYGEAAAADARSAIEAAYFGSGVSR